MEIENTSRIPTVILRPLLSQIINLSLRGDVKTYARGLYIKVSNAKYSAVRGRCYSDACTIYRRGKPINVNGYIKLFVFEHTTLDDVAYTFAHELSHLKDWHREYFENIKVPWGKEQRATAFAEKVMQKRAGKPRRLEMGRTMELGEIREWAQNLREHDEPSERWSDAETLYKFIVKNWDFPGTLADAEVILTEMYA